MKDAIQPKTLVLAGLTLEQYAGVTAALAEEFPLAEILKQERIEPTEWLAAAEAWCEAIVCAANLQIDLTRARRIAEDPRAERQGGSA